MLRLFKKKNVYTFLVWLKEVAKVLTTPKILLSKTRLGLGLPDAAGFGFIRQPGTAALGFAL